MLQIQHDFDLTHKNTLALPSCATHYVALRHVEQIKDIVRYAEQNQFNIFILSGGSNVLLPQKINALVVEMQNSGIELLQENAQDVVIKVQAGEIWHDFVVHCCRQCWHGLENLALIPGRVGASPVQNIGAYGVEVGEFIEQVWAYDLQQRRHIVLSAQECHFAYRDSIFKQHAGRYWIYAVSFRLYKQAPLKLNYADVAKRVGEQPTAEKLLHTVIAIRQEKLPQPQQYPNVGSFFKNPLLSATQFQTFIAQFPQAPHYPQADGSVKIAAGWLIEQAGWKGKRLGEVGMFERQALVLVNYGHADLMQVQQTYRAVQADVWQKFAVALEPEPVLLDAQGQIQAHQWCIS